MANCKKKISFESEYNEQRVEGQRVLKLWMIVLKKYTGRKFESDWVGRQINHVIHYFV